MVLYDSKVVPELGTFANPILIEDDFALLDSSSDPNVIKVDEGWRRDGPDHLDSDADTEIMTTPEFWGSLTSGNFKYREKHEAALDSSSIHVSTRSIDGENLEGLQSVEQLGSNHQALKVAQNSVDDPFGVARRESVADDHEGSEQSTKQGKASKTEELKEDRSVTNTFSITRNGFPEETLNTVNPSWENLSYTPCDMGSMTDRLSHETEDKINRAKCLGKAVLTWDSSMSTAIGDELAEIHNHMEHCRNTDCIQAKAFFDGIQSPQNTLSSNSKRPKHAQGGDEQGRVTMRFYAPEMKKGASWPKSFIVNQVVIRSAFSSGIPCSLENFRHDDTFSGQGAVIVRLEGENPSLFLTFSPKDPRDDHGINFSTSHKRSDGVLILESAGAQREKGANWRHGFTGRMYIEVYKSWPFLASDYEEQEEFFGSVALNFHLDTVDPKFFLTFSSGLSSADQSAHSAAPGNGVRAPSMASSTITQELTAQAGTSGDNLPLNSHVGCLKREFLYDGYQSELRRSERLARKARIQK